MIKNTDKRKQQQLGMNPGTAAGRLNKDILFSFVQKAGYTCYHCKEPMTRENFSIEHKIPWLDSENPLFLYFDLDNIAFSHLSCNVAAARRPTKQWTTEEERLRYRANYTKEWWHSQSKEKRQEMRKNNYQRNGK